MAYPMLRACRALLGLTTVLAAVLVGCLTATGAASADGAGSWTGVYVGGHAGYGWHRGDVGVTSQDPAVFGELPFTLGLDKSGFVGGGQVGYKWQAGPSWVTGIEADLSGAAIKGDARNNAIFTNFGVLLPGAYYDARAQMQWLGTVRGRLGYLAAHGLLIYGTGGLAYGQIADTAIHDYTGTGAAFSVFSGSSSKLKTGWTAGGGAELQLSGNWSAKFEYLFVDLGRETIAQRRVLVLPNDPQTMFSAFNSESHIVRLGVNYSFGSAANR